MYNMENIVNNYIMSLVTDENQTDGDHLKIYRNIKLLCCTLGTNIVL